MLSEQTKKQGFEGNVNGSNYCDHFHTQNWHMTKPSHIHCNYSIQKILNTCAKIAWDKKEHVKIQFNEFNSTFPSAGSICLLNKNKSYLLSYLRKKFQIFSSP